MLDDRDMRATIDKVLDENRPRRGSRAARLAAAVGMSSKFIAGCLVVEYGAPAYGIEEDAAIADGGDVDTGPAVRYGVACDGGEFDAGSAVMYGVVCDAG